MPPSKQSHKFLQGTCPGDFLNTTTSDVQNWLSQTQNSDRQWASIPPQVTSPDMKFASNLSCLSSLCDTIGVRSVNTDKMLFDYYHAVVSTDETHVRRDDEYDPRQYIFLQGLSSPAVALGILMVTAYLWSLTDSSILKLASEYRRLVLEIVKKSSDPGDMMLLAVMLCSMEVRNNGAGRNGSLSEFLTGDSWLVNEGRCGWSTSLSSETSSKSDKVCQKLVTFMTTFIDFVAGTWCITLSLPKLCFQSKRYSAIAYQIPPVHHGHQPRIFL